MKRVEFWKEKREKVLEERWIDMEELSEMIANNVAIRSIPNLNHSNQKIFLIQYQGYIVCVPYVEDEEKIFLKTAYYARKYNKLFNS